MSGGVGFSIWAHDVAASAYSSIKVFGIVLRNHKAAEISKSAPHMRYGAGPKKSAWTHSYMGLVASVGYVFLYPAFFFYHYMVASGIIPPFLAGLYGYVTIAISALAAVPLLLSANYSLSNRVSILYLSFFTYICFRLAIFGYASPSYLATPDVNAQVAATIVAIFALFFVGLFVRQDNNVIVGIMWLFFALIVAITMYFYFVTGSVSVIFAAVFDSGDEIATYQGFARSFLMLSVFLYALIRPTLWRVAFIGAVISILFLLSSRSEAVAFIVGAMFVESFLSGRRAASAFIVILAVGLMVFIISEHTDLIYNSRFRNLFSLGNDTSWNDRNYLSGFAWSQILENPVGGKYGGHVLAGGLGYYSHNILSSWVSFGLVGFVVYAGLIFMSFQVSLFAFLRNMNDSRARLALLVSTIVVVLSLFAKPVFWAEPALAWGLAASLLLHHPSASRARRLTRNSVLAVKA